MESFTSNERLEFLNISYNGLGSDPRDIDILCDFLSKNNNVIELDLEGNCFSRDDLTKIYNVFYETKNVVSSSFHPDGNKLSFSYKCEEEMYLELIIYSSNQKEKSIDGLIPNAEVEGDKNTVRWQNIDYSSQGGHIGK